VDISGKTSIRTGSTGREPGAVRPKDAYTRKVKRRESFAKGMLWLASLVTIGILLSIVGYILFRGFVSNTRHEYEVIAQGSDVVMLGEQARVPVTVVVNRRVKKNDFTTQELRTLFSGEKSNWGLFSEQDIRIGLYALGEESYISDAFAHSVLFDTSFDKDVQFLETDQQVIRSVAADRGGIGFISAESRNLLEGTRVKPVSVRNLAVVVSPDVKELKGGVRLRYLTASQVEGVFTGRIENWRKIGGQDLKIRVVSYPEDDALRRRFRDLALSEGGRIDSPTFVHSFTDLKQALATIPGAVGFARYSDAVTIKEQILPVEQQLVKPNLTLRYILESPRKSGKVGGVSTVILNTVFMILLTLLFSTPVGILAAVYLTEYAKQGRLVKLLRFGTETLAGIPSIIFGLFGFLFFVTILKMGIGLISGTLTITMMILPTIIRTSEEAIKSVPFSYREGSLALGATKWQTIVRSVIPPAIPGILTGVILAVGRAVGETAALLFTMGTDYRLVENLTSSARTLSVHLYVLVKEGISFERAFATATILVFVIIVVNFLTNKLIGKMSRYGDTKI
jgi:phosphate transport system permease protein